MPTWRALLAAAVPGFVVFADFTFWMGFSPAFAIAVGLIVAIVALGVTRLLYDDADAELAAWRLAERELETTPRPTDEPAPRPVDGLAAELAPSGPPAVGDAGPSPTPSKAREVAEPSAGARR